MSPEVISYDTNLDLNETVERYADSVRIPCYLSVGRFATAHTGIEVADSLTLVTVYEGSLAVSAQGSNIERLFLNIDPAKDSPSAIVSPGFYDQEGREDSRYGTFARPIVRPLTEPEGRALIHDLDEIIARLPADRRK